ncbi:MAG: NmrA family NAD(P)-binding protein [Gammaproteobacteria bacterium]|nr:NmrA family NAD(P)-binding protein [Gammaproteobacteria bacterium]
MNDKPILVTGATGKTGSLVIEQLIERGHRVRAMVRSADVRAERLSALGAETMVGDFLDLPSLHAAMRGVERAYFCYPPADRLVEATANIAIAARQAELKALVNMSQLPAREHARSKLSFQHWQSEQILDWAHIGAAHIRPTFFAEDLYLFTGPTLMNDGKMLLPFGDARHAPVTAEDIARVVVGILEDPGPHVGQRHILTGPRNMTLEEMARVISDVLGRPVEYVDIPMAAWHEAMVGNIGFPRFLADHLAAVAQDHQQGIFSAQTDIVERIGGQAPQKLVDFVRAHRAEFIGEHPLSSAA